MSATFDAVLFDLDGVLTPTAALRARWKRVLDERWPTGPPAQELFGQAA